MVVSDCAAEMSTPVPDPASTRKPDPNYPVFDPNNAKILVFETADELESSFQRRLKDYNKALEDPDFEPGNFADCEDELIQTIVNFRERKILFPNFYPKMVDLQAFKSMVGLLKNGSCGKYLARSIILTFNELTDLDIWIEEKAASRFVGLLVSYEAIPVFVSLIGRFSDDGDVNDYFGGKSIEFGALQTIAQMMFVKPDLTRIMCKQTQLVNWVFEALGIDDRCAYRKQYAVGLLVTLLQPSTGLDLGEMGAVNVVVKALLPFTLLEKEECLLLEDEEYLLECLFQCLSYLLLHLDNRIRFAKAGGVDCLIKIMKQEELKYDYYGSAVAALDIALKDCPCACDKFAGASRLDIAFPASEDIISSCIMHDKEEIEELHISLIASLTGGISDETKKDVLLRKFEENDFEKTTWLMDLFIRYFNAVAEGTKQIEARTKDQKLNQSELYNKKVQYGLSTLQLIAVILGYLWLSKKSKIIARIEKELSHHNLKKKDVREILLTYCYSSCGEGESVGQIPAEIKAIVEYIASLEAQEEAAHLEYQKINPDEPVVEDEVDDNDDDDKGEDQLDGDVSGSVEMQEELPAAHLKDQKINPDEPVVEDEVDDDENDTLR